VELASLLSEATRRLGRGNVASGCATKKLCLLVLAARRWSWPYLLIVGCAPCAQLPWICGTFGTVGLDLTIARQSILYGRQHARLVKATAAAAMAAPGSGGAAAAGTQHPLEAPLLPGSGMRGEAAT
jgi:hypothetical protein